jgi:hypothetical protein
MCFIWRFMHLHIYMFSWGIHTQVFSSKVLDVVDVIS